MNNVIVCKITQCLKLPKWGKSATGAVVKIAKVKKKNSVGAPPSDPGISPIFNKKKFFDDKNIQQVH